MQHQRTGRCAITTARRSSIKTIAALAVTAILFAASPLSLAQSDEEPVRVLVRWLPEPRADGIQVPYIALAAHEGALDIHHQGLPANEWLQAAMTTRDGFGDLHDTAIELSQLSPEAVVRVIWNSPYRNTVAITPEPPLWPKQSEATLALDPEQHRFLSFFGRVQPSDDAFFASGDPQQFELFDDQGRFTGPTTIRIYGHQVMDAGLCGNRETSLQWLDWYDELSGGEPPGADCQDGEGVVSVHPGLAGSLRNPDSEQQRVLGGTLERAPPLADIHYDETAADFSQPGYLLGQLVVTRSGQLGYPLTGTWYSPDHAGEGFNLELLEPHPGARQPRLYLHWYTYTPDGSGEQVWLTGIAEQALAGHAQRPPSVRIDLLRTEGGRFGSTENPVLVQRHPWGHVELSFESCNKGSLAWYPLDADWPAGQYSIHRLSPPIAGQPLEAYCAELE